MKRRTSRKRKTRERHSELILHLYQDLVSGGGLGGGEGGGGGLWMVTVAGLSWRSEWTLSWAAAAAAAAWPVPVVSSLFDSGNYPQTATQKKTILSSTGSFSQSGGRIHWSQWSRKIATDSRSRDTGSARVLLCWSTSTDPVIGSSKPLTIACQRASCPSGTRREPPKLVRMDAAKQSLGQHEGWWEMASFPPLPVAWQRCVPSASFPANPMMCADTKALSKQPNCGSLWRCQLIAMSVIHRFC